MNRPTSNHHAHEDQIRGWIDEAGDFRVEPRPEYVEEVRRLLLGRVALPQVSELPPEEIPAPLGIGLARILAAAFVVAVALFAAVQIGRRPDDAWATVAQALQRASWIHIVETGPDGLREESWFSPRFDILAMKHDLGAGRGGAEFHDLKLDTKTEYIAEENTIYRMPGSEGTPKRQPQELEFFHHLRRGEDFKVSPYPDCEIIAQRNHLLTEQGKTWRIYELTLREKSAQKSQDSKLTIRVDPKTSLPQTWAIVSDSGTLQLTFDYPTNGPSDIRSLGVPATAKFVDQLPVADVNQILEGLKVGRNRFDDYCAYVWYDSTVYRVWRKEPRWRIDRALPNGTNQPSTFDPDLIPNAADPAWWKTQESLQFVPEVIGDGNTYWVYHYKPKSPTDEPGSPAEVESVSTNSGGYRSQDDPLMPWSHLQPEQVGHADVGLSFANWQFSLDTHPMDGPPDAVRLSVRNYFVGDTNQSDGYRLWIDPEKNYLALRAEIVIYQPGSQVPRPRNANWLRTPMKVDHIETRILSDLARSPNGFWYPRRVLRKNSKTKVDQVARFAVDFNASIPDELFRRNP